MQSGETYQSNKILQHFSEPSEKGVLIHALARPISIILDALAPALPIKKLQERVVMRNKFQKADELASFQWAAHQPAEEEDWKANVGELMWPDDGDRRPWIM